VSMLMSTSIIARTIATGALASCQGEFQTLCPSCLRVAMMVPLRGKDGRWRVDRVDSLATEAQNAFNNTTL
jgi:hypothetical protein